MKTLIKNARIYDGTGSDPFMGSVLLEDEKIAAVIPAASQEEPVADKVVDLGGLSLSPGFIDGHSHNDWFAIRKDPFPYFEPFLRQGVTTYVTGNCGLSVIGFRRSGKTIVSPDPAAPIARGDVLIVLGREDDLARLKK